MLIMKFSEVICVSFIVLIQFIAKIESGLLGELSHLLGNLVTNDVLPIVETSATLALRRLRTVNTENILKSSQFIAFQLNFF